MRSSLPGPGNAPAQADAGLTHDRPSSPARPLPSDTDIRRFRQALNGMPADDTPVGEGSSEATLPAGPFDLFRSARQPERAGASAAVAEREALRHRLSDMVSRLLVGDGLHGARSVRMTLDESWLPGVDLSVYEEQGFWVAHFCCRVSESFVQLAAPGGDMAVQLAAALNRPCMWRVEGESFPEQGEWRRHVNADGAVPLAEYRVRP